MPTSIRKSNAVPHSQEPHVMAARKKSRNKSSVRSARKSAAKTSKARKASKATRASKSSKVKKASRASKASTASRPKASKTAKSSRASKASKTPRTARASRAATSSSRPASRKKSAAPRRTAANSSRGISSRSTSGSGATRRLQTRKESPGLQELLVLELQEIHNAEKQLARLIPRLASAATSEDLRIAIEERLEEGEQIIAIVENGLEELGASPGRKKNVAAEGLTN